MERSVKATRELVQDYEDAIAELGEEDRHIINVWLTAVEEAVSDVRLKNMRFGKSNFGRASAIELLHLRLFGNLEGE